MILTVNKNLATGHIHDSRCARLTVCRRARESMPLQGLVGNFDFDLFGLDVLALWHMQREDAILKLRVYFGEIGVGRAGRSCA